MNRMTFRPTSEEIQKIPTGKSGVYFFYDENESLLYIGRAKNLKNRINTHLTNYYYHCEGLFYRKMLHKMGWDPNNRDEWHKSFQRAWIDFTFRGMSRPHAINIDYHWFKITKIEIEEIPPGEYKEKEKELIKQYDPMYNSQNAPSISDEYLNAVDF